MQSSDKHAIGAQIERRFKATSMTYEIAKHEVLVKRSHKKKGTVLAEKPRLGPGGGRAAGARSATHYRSHVKYAPGTTPTSCYICQGGLANAIRIQRNAIFDPFSDPVLRQFPEFPQDLDERFHDPKNNLRFIQRWKALTEVKQIRFLRFVMYLERSRPVSKPESTVIQSHAVGEDVCI